MEDKGSFINTSNNDIAFVDENRPVSLSNQKIKPVEDNLNTSLNFEKKNHRTLQAKLGERQTIRLKKSKMGGCFSRLNCLSIKYNVEND